MWFILCVANGKNHSTEKQPSVNSQSASSTGKSSGSAAAEQDSAYSSSNYFVVQAAEHLNAKISPYMAMLSAARSVSPAFDRLPSSVS